MSGGKHISRNRFKLCLKINKPNAWLNYKQESVKKFAPFFSDLVLNAKFLEQINDRYSKN